MVMTPFVVVLSALPLVGVGAVSKVAGLQKWMLVCYEWCAMRCVRARGLRVCDVVAASRVLVSHGGLCGVLLRRLLRADLELLLELSQQRQLGVGLVGGLESRSDAPRGCDRKADGRGRLLRREERVQTSATEQRVQTGREESIAA